MTDDNRKQLSDAAEHAWRYFELHAGQRMALFNFFLVLSGLAAAGLGSTVQGSPQLAPVGVMLGVLIAFVAFVFWKLDRRVSTLVKLAEAALLQIEQDFSHAELRIFGSEAARLAGDREAGRRVWTFGRCFRSVFFFTGTVGLAGATFSLARWVGLIV